MTTQSSDPDQIRDEIESTRSDLSANVNALADSVRPGNVARRQAKGSVTDLKDRVMGAADDAGSSASESLGSAKQAAADAPGMVANKARGNPLAAGVIAFGAGWLLGSMLPASSMERDAASTLKDKAEPLIDTAKQAAHEVADNLQEPAAQAVADLKASATESVANVKDEARQGADDSRPTRHDRAGRRGRGPQPAGMSAHK